MVSICLRSSQHPFNIQLSIFRLTDDQLAEFIVESLEEQPLVDHAEMWGKLLADYGIERVDFIQKSRKLLGAIADKAQAEQIEQMLSSQCIIWNCSEDQLQEIRQLIDEFKQKLKNSTKNSSYLQEMFIVRIDILPLDENIRISLVKIIYERCLTKYPSDSGLWLEYLAYMQRTGDDAPNDGYLKSTPWELIKRALRVLKPSIKLNHKYLQLMELHQFSLQKIDEELGSLFIRIERYMEMTVELQLDYLAYRVRHTNVEDEQEVSCGILKRDSFCINILLIALKNNVLINILFRPQCKGNLKNENFKSKFITSNQLLMSKYFT